MDLRNDIIDTIMTKMECVLTGNESEYLQNVLFNTLNQYEIQKRSTDIVIRDGTSNAMLKRFVATKRIEGKSESTIEYYKTILQPFLLKITKRLHEVTAFDIRFFLSVYKQTRKVSNRTLENMRKVLSSFFTWLYDEELIPHNPCKAVKNIKFDKIVRKGFSDEELERLKNNCTNARDIALVHFLHSTGCRVSEVVSINIEDVDFQNREIIVYGKGAKERTVYLSNIACMYLKKYLTRRKDGNNALFIGKGNKRLGKGGIEAFLSKLGKKSSVNNVHPHRFRRTLATELVKKGVPIQYVADILGHADLRTTQVYVCLDKEQVKYNYNMAIA